MVALVFWGVVWFGLNFGFVWGSCLFSRSFLWNVLWNSLWNDLLLKKDRFFFFFLPLVLLSQTSLMHVSCEKGLSCPCTEQVREASQKGESRLTGSLAALKDVIIHWCFIFHLVFAALNLLFEASKYLFRNNYV